MKLLKKLSLTALFCIVAGALPAQNPEMRAYWCSRFEWPGNGEANTKAKIRSIFDNLEANNFNTVLFQVRGQCETLYPNPYEPWGSQFNFTDPGWDPLAFAIEEAHSRGLELHAYINTHTISQGTVPSTTSPQHLYNIHGPGGANDWVIHDDNGDPVGTTDGYVWTSPGIPEASWWTRRAVMYVVENYDVDGVHFDRIRTPAPNYSYDPITVSRFEGDGNPDTLEWGDFMRSQFTRDLRKIYGAVNKVKPNVVISSAPFGICRTLPDGYQGTGTESYHSWYQDSFGWMESHVMDVLFPQIYWEIDSGHPFDVLLEDFMKFDGGRHIYAGINARNNEVEQILRAREISGLGTVIWPGDTVEFANILAGPYAEPASTPELPWKTNPTVGILTGSVTDALGSPVVDATITIQGDDYNYLSAWDGFYTILDLEPGVYQVVAEKEDYGIATGSITIDVGDVLTLDLTFPEGSAPLIIDNDEAGFSTEGNWLLSSFGNNYGQNKRYLNGQDPDAMAVWTFPDLPEGRYAASFYVNNNDYVSDATYRIYDGDLLVDTVTENQSYRGDGWVNLGVYTVENGSFEVQLPGVWESSQTILAADAMRIQLLGAMEEQGGEQFVLY